MCSAAARANIGLQEANVPERRKDGENMGRLLRRAGVWVAAWVCGTLVCYVVLPLTFFPLPLGLVFGLVAGAVSAALAAFAAAGRVAPVDAGTLARPARVVLASLGSLLLLGLPASAVLSGPGLPPISPIPVAMALAAAGATHAAFRSRRPRVAACPEPSSPRSRRGRFFLPLLAMAAPLVLVLGAFWLPAVWACSSAERAVYGEFPQYGGRAVEPSGNPDSGSCAAYYQTPDTEEEVFAYFRERFGEHGWEEAPHESYRMEGGELVPTDLVAHRGDFSYRVSVEGIDPEAGGHAPGTHVATHVSHRDWDAIPPPGPPGGTAPAGGGAPGRDG